MLSNSAAPKFDSALRLLRGALPPLARLLPQHCALCAAASADALVCDACARALPAIGDACPSCALPVPGGARCGACLRRPPPHTHAIAALAYAFPVDRLVMRLKYAHQLALAVPLADSLAAAVLRRAAAVPLPDALVPLPLAASRQRARGFNQACEIARPLARTLGVPLLHALERERDSPAQASLPRARRAANVRGAFRVVMPVRGLSLAVVDDVMTTGATLAAAARACLGAGAARADAWAAARTLPPGAA